MRHRAHEGVQAEEAHRVTRRRLEEAEAHTPQDDVKALLASERIQRLEADLALKTRASEEAVRPVWKSSSESGYPEKYCEKLS